MANYSPISIFDSGYGGLTVLKEIYRLLPEYDYMYVGDNARAPYGTRSYEVVYRYTLDAVRYLFKEGSPLTILACNTASAKALRSIQQTDLPNIAPDNRVLGVIRPAVEKAGELSTTGHVGVLGTTGTINSNSYPIELTKWSGGKITHVSQQDCPMWVPIIENGEELNPASLPFIKSKVEELLAKDVDIDLIILACTHYPLIKEQIKKFLPSRVSLMNQAALVAERLQDYLQRHPQMEKRISRGGSMRFLTTEDNKEFAKKGSRFWASPITAATIHL
ncbi:MAG: glutamate racemase [Bacteroidales bacterium]